MASIPHDDYGQIFHYHARIQADGLAEVVCSFRGGSGGVEGRRSGGRYHQSELRGP